MANELHSIPCKIKYSGPAKISDYFNCTREIQVDGNFTASFRGKLLTGAEVEIPTGYALHAVQKSPDDKTVELGNTEQRLNDVGNVKKFTYWNYDSTPTGKDPLAKSISWIKIAEKLSKNDD